MRHNLMDVLKIDKARGMSHLPQEKLNGRQQTVTLAIKARIRIRRNL